MLILKALQQQSSVTGYEGLCCVRCGPDMRGYFVSVADQIRGFVLYPLRTGYEGLCCIRCGPDMRGCVVSVADRI